jgi:hypothetical protein
MRCRCGYFRDSSPIAPIPPTVEEQKHTEIVAGALAADPVLHPNGHCTCAGEGRCEWCVWHAVQQHDERLRTLEHDVEPAKEIMTHVLARLDRLEKKP